jgi:tetratricopeptide (TPR) repeat protein
MQETLSLQQILHKGIEFQQNYEFAKAENIYRQVLSFEPESPDTLQLLGITLGQQNRQEESLPILEKAAKLAPTRPDILYNLGNTLSSLGRTDEGLAFYRKAIEHNPSHIRIYKGICSLHKFTEYDDEMKKMEELLKIEMQPIERINLLFGLGKAFDDIKDYEKSFRYLNEGNKLQRSTFNYNTKDNYNVLEKIKKTFTPEFLEQHRDCGHKSNSPIFILGMPRSGTSLVEQIISSHSEVYGAGELGNINDIITKNSGKLSMPNFPDGIEKLKKYDFRKLGSLYIQSLAKIAPDSPYITDKMPNNFWYIGIIKLILPNAKIIHCTRNPIDTCLSIYQKLFNSKLTYAYDLEELGQFYNLYKELMEHWHSILPEGSILDISYEELVNNQEQQTKRMLEYCNLPWDESCMTFHQNKRAVNTASVLQVREPIYKHAIERWKPYEKYLQPLIETLGN